MLLHLKRGIDVVDQMKFMHAVICWFGLVGVEMGSICESLPPYILKAKQLAEFTFQVKQLAEKVRKSRQQNFTTNVRKS